MEKEIIVITQSGTGGSLLTDGQITELKKEVREKTGKDVIVLAEGMTLDTIVVSEHIKRPKRSKKNKHFRKRKYDREYEDEDDDFDLDDSDDEDDI